MYKEFALMQTIEHLYYYMLLYCTKYSDQISTFKHNIGLLGVNM